MPLDKLIHSVVFLVLIIIWLWYYFIKKNRRIGIKSIIAILSICFIYGILIEIIQLLFISSRKADYFDILANSFGLIIGTLFFLKLKSRIKS